MVTHVLTMPQNIFSIKFPYFEITVIFYTPSPPISQVELSVFYVSHFSSIYGGILRIPILEFDFSV